MWNDLTLGIISFLAGFGARELVYQIRRRGRGSNGNGRDKQGAIE